MPAFPSSNPTQSSPTERVSEESNTLCLSKSPNKHSPTIHEDVALP